MAKCLAWISTTVISLAGIVIGVLPVELGPRWVWLAVGIALGLLAALTFPRVWRSDQGDAGPSVEQSIKTGKNSRTIQAGGDVKLRGGMGDRE